MRRFLLSGLVLLYAVSMSTPVFAQGFSLEKSLQNLGNGAANIEAPNYLPGARTKSGNEGQAARVTGIIQNIANGLAGLAAAVAVLFIVMNAFQLAISAGEQDKVSKAKKGLVWAFGGLVLIIFSYIIAKTVISFTYLKEESPNSPPPASSVEQPRIPAGTSKYN